MSQILSKDQILGVEDLPSEDVHIPEWGGSVRIRGMTASERDSFEADIAGEKANWQNFRARWIVYCCIDEKGNKIFDKRDAKQLGQKSGKAVSKLFSRLQHLSGMTSEAAEEKQGNSDNGQSEDSSSDSASDSDTPTQTT